MADTCTGTFQCRAVEHDEDTDCDSVIYRPPQCAHHVDVGFCRECAANPPPGWQLVDCDQGHPVMWMPDDDWSYPPPCMYCCYDLISKQHAPCRHAGHGRWRRWKITHKLSLWSYSMGITVGGATTWDGHCNGCLNSVRFRGKRHYILGWQREKWRCLLVMRHWPGEMVGMGLCGKCAPWPCCGSTFEAHTEDCPEQFDPRALEVSCG
jgi:hypothetical protein